MAPSNVSVRLVDKPDEALIEEAVQVFSKLMPEDPAAISFTGGDISLISDLARAMIKPIALIAGDMYTATDENGALVGFTLWVPPGQLLFATEEQRQLGFYDFLGMLSDEGKAYYPQVLGTDFPTVIDELAGMESTELKCYWCNFAFVKADYQGKGVAKAMFELAYEKAKQNEQTMALATTNIRNVEIYKRLGFELKGLRHMPSPWGDWPAWIFVRSTRAEEN